MLYKDSQTQMQYQSKYSPRDYERYKISQQKDSIQNLIKMPIGEILKQRRQQISNSSQFVQPTDSYMILKPTTGHSGYAENHQSILIVQYHVI